MIEIRELTLSLRQHAFQDVRGIILVSQQMQKLEDLNSDYMRLFFPGKSKHTNIARVERSRAVFHSNWQKLEQRIRTAPEPDFIDRALKKIYYFLFELIDDAEYDKRIAVIAGDIETQWAKSNRAIRETVLHMRKGNISQARYWRDVRFKSSIVSLRESLAELNKILGKRGNAKAFQMARIARQTQWVILWTELVVFLMTIAVAYFSARKLTKPIPELKEAIDRIAIQDFEVEIKNKSNDEIGELSAAFEQLSERLRESNTYKTSMLSQFTHEMKSPLGSIKQAVFLLEDTLPQKDKQQERFFKIIKNNYETLFKLINNILHSATYNPEDIHLRYIMLNIRKLVEDVLVDLAPLFREKKINVEINKSSESIIGEFDKDRMDEVFHNLFSNAIKFSPQNTTLNVVMNAKAPIIEILIKDEGIGIPPKEIPYIFEKMYRASNSKKISVKGTGLGLYITSQIIRAHGGRIKVESEENRGTTFKIIIPRNRNIAKEGGWFETG